MGTLCESKAMQFSSYYEPHSLLDTSQLVGNHFESIKIYVELR